MNHRTLKKYNKKTCSGLRIGLDYTQMEQELRNNTEVDLEAKELVAVELTEGQLVMTFVNIVEEK